MRPVRERAERDQIRSVVTSLRDEFGSAGEGDAEAEIRRVVAREYWHYKSAHVRVFVPTLVHRGAREALRRRRRNERFSAA